MIYLLKNNRLAPGNKPLVKGILIGVVENIPGIYPTIEQGFCHTAQRGYFYRII